MVNNTSVQLQSCNLQWGQVVAYIVQSFLEKLSSVLQCLLVQLYPPVSFIIQKAGQGHLVIRHVACHCKES